ncbi:ATP-binding protein [Oceanobacillus profundus]|uniref:histidine kinase n=1 Tax=Oceanobacillus profundus TaxID=372463 RepID=A0A417YDB4_9BACI|nr:ATP-binding protein [Oceanobacillus profundus]MCM3397434.1 ATP-binding protein [Oceanobacillus profundus]PAE28974.1 histidine kinase [Paenibacillus sp. 7884-2]RHW30606.1 GHKL domain-containing protein [Oceanobacillus profundus]
MKQLWGKVSLKGQVMLFTSLIVILSLLILSLFVAYNQSKNTKDNLAEKVQISASHIAYNTLIQDSLLVGETNQELIDYVELVREENDFLYIVVMDNQKIRFTHPDREKIGQTFVGSDAEEVLEGEKYTSEDIGTLGPSMRAFHPVWDQQGNQIGAVSVGIATKSIQEAVLENQIILIMITAISLILGLIGAWYLANRMKKTLNGMEPKEIALAVQERNSMLEAVNDGMLAINNTGEVLLANDTAQQFLRRTGYQGQFEHTPIDLIWPELKLQEAIKTKSTALHELIKRGDVETIVTRVPIYVNNQCVGALATFNERSQLNDLMRQLIGAEVYAHSLRSETHEFMNKLHIIQAMVETESYEELKDYIADISERYHLKTASAASQVGQLVEDVSIAHYLAKRIGWMEQMGVNVHVQSGIPWPSMNTEFIDTWVTVIGNTCDNAWEAMKHKEHKNLTLTLKQVGGVLRYVIEDNGIGFSASEQQVLISSKKGDHGYGIANIKKKIQLLNGTLDILSEKDKGTIITVHIPYTERS